MKNQGSDKFLNICFNAGKILSIVMLFITLITFCVSGVVLLCLQSSNVEIPSFKTVEKIIADNENVSSPQNDLPNNQDNISNNDKKIDNIIKKNKLNYQVKKIINNYYSLLPKKFQPVYLSGLDAFCKQGLETLNKNDKLMRKFNTVVTTNRWGGMFEDCSTPVMSDGVYNLIISQNIVSTYNELFNKNMQKTQVQDTEKNVAKIVVSTVLAISLMLFVVFLFLPVLIKIEENTKRLLFIKEREN